MLPSIVEIATSGSAVSKEQRRHLLGRGNQLHCTDKSSSAYASKGNLPHYVRT
jgi:hypothetical protein